MGAFTQQVCVVNIYVGSIPLHQFEVTSGSSKHTEWGETTVKFINARS